MENLRQSEFTWYSHTQHIPINNSSTQHCRKIGEEPTKFTNPYCIKCGSFYIFTVNLSPYCMKCGSTEISQKTRFIR